MSRREPWFHVALVEPVIPQNTGNVGRIALALGARLHLVGKLGFAIDAHALRRAGLDYWEHLDLATWPDLAALEGALPRSRPWLFSAHGRTPVSEVPFARGDLLVFGNEPRGLPRELVEAAGERSVRIPIASPHARSLNLANAVSIGAYEAARRLGFPADPGPLAPEEWKGEEPGRPRRGTNGGRPKKGKGTCAAS